MDEIKNLFKVKRVLAMFLAVAMVVTLLPTTTNAAQVSDKPMAETAVTDNEPAAEAAVNETEPTTEAAGNGTEPTTEPAGNETEPTTEPAVNKTEPETETGTVDTQEPQEDKAALDVYEIIDNRTDAQRLTLYNGYSIRFDANNLRKVNINKNGELFYNVYQILNNMNGSGSFATYKYKEYKDGEYVDMAEGAEPVNAGKYQIEITIPPEEGVTDGLVAGIGCEIIKVGLTPSILIGDVAPGTLAKDVTIESCEYSGGSKTFVYSKTEADSDLALSWKVKDAITGEVLADDAVLTNKQDYVLEVAVSFTAKVSDADKANYELTQMAPQNITMSDLIPSYVTIELADALKDAGKITRPYTGKEIAVPDKTTEYTQKIQYKTESAAGEELFVDIPGVSESDIRYTWQDEYGSILEKAPAEAGTYYYVISYAGKTGLYAKSENKIEVEITPVEIVLSPAVKETEEFYTGMSEADVLSKVDYTVLDKEGNTVTIDRETFWGTSYSNTSRTQPYEPVFTLQRSQTDADGNPVKDADGNIVYENNDGEDLDSTKAYRVIFSGKKAVYNASGTSSYSLSINGNTGASASKMDSNYIVKVDSAELEKHIAAVTVKAGEKAEIDITNILKDGKGAEEANPIKKVYDEEGIYAKRADYKKAVVKTGDGKDIAKDADLKLTYTWYRDQGTSENPQWVRQGGLVSPCDAGSYKLEISYQDPEKKYYAASKTVYYEIEQQKVKVVLTGEPKALTDTAVYDFDFSQIGWEIYTVPAEGEGKKLEWPKDGYTVYLQVEKAVTDSEGKESYVNAGGENFAKDTKYRVAVDELEMHYYDLYNNYVNYEVVTDGTSQTEVYLNEPADITMEIMGETEVKIQIDATKLSKTEKEYDGEAFDLSEDIKNGLVTTVKTADNSAVNDIPLEYRWYDETAGEDTDEPVNGGNYTLYAYFKGNTAYKAIPETEVAKVKITPKTVTIKPYIKEPVTAGSAYYDAYDYGKTEITGYVEKDAKDFLASLGYYFTMEDNTDQYCLKGEKTYAIETRVYRLDAPYDRNYSVKGETVSFTTVRGNSTVSGDDYFGREVAVMDKIEGMQHTITAKEGIIYSYGEIYDEESDTLKDGNYLAVRIQMPSEYDANRSEVMEQAVYENSIEAAGGYLVDLDEYEGYLVAAFEAEGKKEFDIRWEEGYIEHFVVDFTDAVLLSDLTQAVAPKQIAFNSPVTKMAVGEEQVLDVKLTKEQMGDIVYLVYESDNTEVLGVNEYGYALALKKGKASVTVYPAKLVNGEMVKIEGAKTAKVTITVNDVTAPKIKKIKATDVDATVEFSYVPDGYRREIYVLEGKNRMTDEFETKIASMKNEQWEDIFAIAPQYTTSWYYKNGKIDGGAVWFYGLKANTDYTVYVRNVSGIRKTWEGDKVVPSKAGSVKSFTTTKSQVRYLHLNFDKELELDKNRIPQVKLSAGTTKVSVKGIFEKLPEDAAADVNDIVSYLLPLGKDQQKNYVNPKLVYQVARRSSSDNGNWIAQEGGHYYYSTPLASIDKAGKIKLNGVGQVYVRAYDSNTGRSSEWYPLQILASADSVAAKNTKLQVGQSIALSSLLTYKEGKKTLTGSFAKSILEDEALTKAFADNAYFELNNGRVTAVKAGGSITVDLTDQNVQAAGGKATAKVTLKSTPLEPVKNLKIVNTMDQYFDIQFAYTGYASAFRITVTDARGSVMRSAYVERYDIYNTQNKLYEYRMLGLTNQSKYNITVTALFGEESSKSVSKSVKTSKMPASYISLGKDGKGGLTIYVTDESYGETLGNYPHIVSGNAYTLIAGGSGLNEGAKKAASDTLIWTSSNTKVATVKPNAGSYTAAFKALRAGTTVIEVKSKLTKQVIARYEVDVSAVGTGADYYGDNEPLKGNRPPVTTDELSFVNGSAWVSLEENPNFEWIKFRAPNAGTYKFYSTGDWDTVGTLYDENKSTQLNHDDDSGDGYNFSVSRYVNAGETVYLYVTAYGEPASFYVYAERQ